MMRKKIIVSSIISIAIIMSLGILTMTIIANNNKDFVSSHEDIFGKLTTNYAKDKKTVELAEVVAYINDVPVYMAEVVYYQELAKINYETIVLSNIRDEYVLEYALKLAGADVNEIVYMIAQSRAMIAESERLGYTISDIEIKEAQQQEQQQRNMEIENGNEITKEIYNDYKELYKKLNVTEDKFYETYDFISQKSALASRYAISAYMDEHNKIEFDVGEAPNPHDVQFKYYEELGKKMDVRFVQD